MTTSVSTLAFAVQHEDMLPQHSDNVDEELQRIRLALDAVFGGGASVPAGPTLDTQPQNQHQQQQDWWYSQRQLADRYLTSFQSTTVSWMVCDRLLQDASDVPSVAVQAHRRFFAAQTLHIKCQGDIYELPVESLPSLRDSILQHLHLHHAMTSTGTLQPQDNVALMTRLAMCVAALAVQMRWTTIVTDLLGMLQQQQQQPTSNPHESPLTNHSQQATTSPALLLQRPVVMYILRVLPEECASERLNLYENDHFRYEMRDHLVTSAAHILDFLLQDQQYQQRIFQVFHSWIRYVPILPQTLTETPLLPASVQALTHPPLMEYAADVVVEILRMYPSHHYVNEPLVQCMIPLLSQLPLQTALQSDDEDVLRTYCRVVTEMGESYMSWILSPQHGQAKVLVEWVLHCSGIAHPYEEIAAITLHFWYRMVMDLEGMDPFEWRQELIDVYSPHLLSLMDVIVTNLMKYPVDIAEIAQDEVEDLNRHRFYVAETVEDLCRLLGGDCILQRIGHHLQQQVHLVHASGQHQHQQDQQQQLDWQGLESCLACVGAIHRFIPSDESEYLPFLFQLLPELPSQIAPLRFTASRLIGKFASWLAAHSELLKPLLPYLAQGLSMTECAPAAAVAIKELCECSNQNFAIAEPVLHLYEEIAAQPGRLELADELHILEGVCRALSRQVQDTNGDGHVFVGRLVQPMGHRLAALVSDPHASPRKMLPDIDRFTTLVQFLTLPAPPGQPHPILSLVSSTWHMLVSASDRYPDDIMLAEKICRFHKHALRSCGPNAYAPMLDTLIQQLVQSFDRSHQSPYLYAASICITEYGQDPAYSQRLYEMVEAMSRTVFSFLRTLPEFTNNPDVVEEFFYMMGRMMTHCPDPVVTSPTMLLSSLCQCAAVGMQLDHQGANKGTLKFLENIISYGLSLREQHKPNNQIALEQALTQEGGTIVTNLARAMMGDLPTYSNQIPEILWKLNLLCPRLLVQWLGTAFEVAPLPERAKTDFMGALDTGLARDEFSLAVRAFQAACDRQRKYIHKQQQHQQTMVGQQRRS